MAKPEYIEFRKHQGPVKLPTEPGTCSALSFDASNTHKSFDPLVRALQTISNAKSLGINTNALYAEVLVAAAQNLTTPNNH